MGRTRKIAIVSMFTLATAVCVAGFYHTDPVAELQAGDAAPADALYEGRARYCMTKDAELQHNLSALSVESVPPASRGVSDLSFGSDGRAYRRDASLSVRVGDVFDSLAAIERLAAAAKGTLESIDVSGSPTTHDGRIRLAVPSDKFTEVFGKLRQLGDVLAERITAQMVTLNAGRGGAEVKDETIELVRIDLSLSDNPERVAKTKVGAMMGAAWQKGMEHFAKGGAVLLEGAGYVLPFILSFGAILIVVGAFGLIARLFGRVANAKIPYAVPAE